MTCGLARAGVGVSQAIGTGGRDMSEPVGGLMMLAGLRALQDDPETAVIVLISKPPAPPVAGRVFAQLRLSGKPTIVCFLGADPLPIEAACGLHVTNLTQAAAAAGALARGEQPEVALAKLEGESAGLIPLAAAEQKKLATGQRALRGLLRVAPSAMRLNSSCATCRSRSTATRHWTKTTRWALKGRGHPDPTTRASTWARTSSPRAACTR